MRDQAPDAVLAPDTKRAEPVAAHGPGHLS